MRGIIQDQASHRFIEGPIPFRSMDNSFQEGTAEKAADHADLARGYEIEPEPSDIDIPYYETNERYD